MTGALPFIYLTTCGCVFSAAGLRALSTPADQPNTPPSDSKDTTTTKPTFLCPQCSTPYDRQTDVRTINPSEEEAATMREAMEARRAAKKTAAAAAGGTKGKKRKAAELGGDTKRVKTVKEEEQARPSTNPHMATVAKKVAASLAEGELKRKGAMTDAVASLYASKDGPKKKETFMTMNTFTRVSIFSQLR